MRRWWLWAVAGTLILLISSQQTWTTGTWRDPVLGVSLVEATGTDVAGTLTAGALLAGAALLAGLVGARPVRLVAAICLAGGAVLAGLPAVQAVSDPRASLEQIAGQRPGAASLTIQVDDPSPTLWPWLALAAAVLVLVSGVLCAVRWFSSADTRAAGHGVGADPVTADPGAPAAGRGPRRARPRDPWDDLTDGHDPTVDP